jgi:hypothetical protein
MLSPKGLGSTEARLFAPQPGRGHVAWHCLLISFLAPQRSVMRSGSASQPDSTATLGPKAGAGQPQPAADRRLALEHGGQLFELATREIGFRTSLARLREGTLKVETIDH